MNIPYVLPYPFNRFHVMMVGHLGIIQNFFNRMPRLATCNPRGLVPLEGSMHLPKNFQHAQAHHTHKVFLLHKWSYCNVFPFFFSFHLKISCKCWCSHIPHYFHGKGIVIIILNYLHIPNFWIRRACSETNGYSRKCLLTHKLK